MDTVLSFLDNFLSTHTALVGAVALWLWNHLSTSKRDYVEEKISEVCAAAWNLAAASSELGVPLGVLLEQARQLAHDKVTRLGIPLSKTILGLVDHELDVLAGKLAGEHLEQQVADLAERAQHLDSVWGPSEAAGRVNGAPLGVTTILPQDAAPANQTTEQALATLDPPSPGSNAASLPAPSGSTDTPTAASTP